jgi:hypothetical protein
MDNGQTVRRTRKCTKRKFTPSVVEKLAPVMSPGEIAALQGVHRTTVMRYLKSHEIKCTQADLEKDLSTDLLLSSRQALDLKNRIAQYYLDMDNDSFSALPHSVKGVVWNNANNHSGTDFDKYRLAAGMSTSNVDVHANNRKIEDIRAELAKLRGEHNVHE